MLHRLATDLQRIGQRRQIGIAQRRLLQRAQQQAGQLQQLGFRPGRQRNDRGPLLADGRHGPRPVVFVFFDHHVGIGPAGAEGRHRSNALAFLAAAIELHPGPMPLGQRLLDHEGTVGEVDLGVGFACMQRRRQLAVLELHQHLGDAGDAGSAFTMTEIGFDRADRAGLFGRRPGAGAERPGQAGDLDRIAQRSAGAVGLDIAHRPGVDTGPGQGVGHQPALGQGVGHGIAVGLAAGVDHAALDHPVDPIAVCLGPGQGLEQQRAHALAGDETVGIGTEGLAPFARRQHFHVGQAHVVHGVDHQIDPADQHAIADAAVQAFQRQVDGGER